MSSAESKLTSAAKTLLSPLRTLASSMSGSNVAEFPRPQSIIPTVDDTFRGDVGALDLPPRLLMGATASNPYPRVLQVSESLITHQYEWIESAGNVLMVFNQAMVSNVAGTFDGSLVKTIGEIQSMLKYVFQTRNSLTLALSGSGTFALEVR